MDDYACRLSINNKQLFFQILEPAYVVSGKRGLQPAVLPSKRRLRRGQVDPPLDGPRNFR